jgi:biopolymer transport protein ExbD
MSHGGDEGAVPNLTPLLDVVLQLLMFFMMCVNFVSDAINKDINLPVSQMARSMEKSDATSVLFLNITRAGEVDVPGMDTKLSTPGDIKFYLKQQFADDERAEAGRGAKRSVVIRADQATDYDKIYLVLTICKEVGYKKLQLRAMMKNQAAK